MINENDPFYVGVQREDSQQTLKFGDLKSLRHAVRTFASASPDEVRAANNFLKSMNKALQKTGANPMMAIASVSRAIVKVINRSLIWRRR